MSDAEMEEAIAQELFTTYCVGIASNALLLYEYIITSRSEVSLFWSRKLSASIPFLVVRFLVLATAVFGIATHSTPSICTNLSGCMASIIFSMFVEFSSLAMLAVISAMRVYAVSGRQWLITAVALLVGVLPVGVNVYAASHATIYFEGGVCSYDTNLTGRENFIFALLSRLATIVCDVIVVATIWVKTYSLAKYHAQTRSFNQSLLWYLLRDGTVYFIVLLILNVVDIFLFYFKSEVNFLASIILPLSLILISRLLINLREVASSRGLDETSTTTHTSSFEVQTPFEMSTIVFGQGIEDGAPKRTGFGGDAGCYGGHEMLDSVPEECAYQENADEIEMIHLEA